MMANQNIKSWSAGTESARKKPLSPAFFLKKFLELSYIRIVEKTPHLRDPCLIYSDTLYS